MIIFTGQPKCFCSGYIGFIAQQEEVSENEMFSSQGIERLQTMGHETRSVVNRPAEGSFWTATVQVMFGLLAIRWSINKQRV